MIAVRFERGGRLAEVIQMLQPIHGRHINDHIALITCFLDESGTHGRASSNIVVAGFLGNSDSWRIFEDRWLQLAEEYPEIFPVHGKDLLSKKGLYLTWSSEKYWKLIVELSAVIGRANLIVISCGLHNADYQSYRKRLIGTKVRADSAYGMCFGCVRLS
jgi:hypothetical protein